MNWKREADRYKLLYENAMRQIDRHNRELARMLPLLQKVKVLVEEDAKRAQNEAKAVEMPIESTDNGKENEA